MFALQGRHSDVASWDALEVADTWCGKRDSNPHGGYPPTVFKTAASAVPPFPREGNEKAGPEARCWSGRRDSNSRPSPWQGDALPLSHFRTSFVPLFYSSRSLASRRVIHDPGRCRLMPCNRRRQLVAGKESVRCLCLGFSSVTGASWRRCSLPCSRQCASGGQQWMSCSSIGTRPTGCYRE